jgi:phage-related protein
MVVNDPRIVHTGLGGGYITLNMRCNSPFIYSPVFMSDTVEIAPLGVGEQNIFHDGYGDLYPEISITKIGSGNILIRNVSNGGGEFELRNLDDGEQIYINTEKEIIKSDSESIGVYRYNNAFGEFPFLTYGHNLLEIEGGCQIQFRYQFKYRF